MSDLVNRLRIHAGMVAMCEPVSWGSDTALMNEAADLIEQLKAALANARNDALEEAAQAIESCAFDAEECYASEETVNAINGMASLCRSFKE